MESIIQSEVECYLCGTTLNLHSHHIFAGCYRNKSEKYGMKVYLCMEHHTGGTGVHLNRNLDLKLKVIAQKRFEEVYSHEKYMQEFKKNYL